MSTAGETMMLAGRIIGPYGIKGWVKVHALTDPPENFLTFRSYELRKGRASKSVEFSEGRPHGKGLIARLAGVEDRSDAEQLKGHEVWVPRQELPELEPGEYYWHQLEGLQVFCDHDGQRLLLGQVDHLLETGANDVLVLAPCSGSVDERERLLPYLPGDVVLDVDLDQQSLLVDWHPED